MKFKSLFENNFCRIMLMIAIILCPACMTKSAWAAELVILHTNDMHARIAADDDSGSSIGIEEIAAVVKSEKAKNEDTLWLDAGDTFHGMPIINISNGENMVRLLNQAGLDAMVPGNHDFNYGSDRLEYLAKKLHADFLSANIIRKGSHERIFNSHTLYKLSDGTVVGVFGLTTPETAFKTNPPNVAAVEFLNPVESARQMAGELRGKCDVLVAVVHMGLDRSSEFTSDRIAREVNGIDLIIDGHSHTELPEGLWVNDTLIVQTGWHDYNLGRVDIRVEDHKIKSREAKLLSKDDVNRMGLKPDPAISKTMQTIEKKSEKLFSEVVATSERTLTSDRQLVRTRETELGNLCTDALRWRTGADFAVINGGSLRCDLPEGKITKKDIMTLFPFGNTVKTAEIQGKVVKDMLEHSVFAYPDTFGGFLQVSGISFTCDPSQPAGSRISNIKIAGSPLDESRIYRLASNDYLLAGGDDFDMLKDLHIIGEFDTCDGVVADYLNKVGMPDIGIGRIEIKQEIPSVQAGQEDGEINEELPEEDAA